MDTVRCCECERDVPLAERPYIEMLCGLVMHCLCQPCHELTKAREWRTQSPRDCANNDREE